MPYVAPSTVVAGQTYSASAHNVIVNDVIDHEARINQYAGVYTNEAARDAAITSPTEGMRVYLTAPTIPAATGGTTMVPSGIVTIYNGSVWVCVTPVGAYTSNQGYTNSTSYTTTLSGTPGTMPSVTLVTGTTALVCITAQIWNNTANYAHYCSVSVSGAGTVAASDAWCMVNPVTGGHRFTSMNIIPGLTAGTNTFTMAHKSNNATNSGYTELRHLWVQGIA